MPNRCLILAAILIAHFGLAIEPVAPTKPNVLFILVDDLGATDLGAFGASLYETPNLDKLAASGAAYREAYATCPVCSPSRASLMTGKYPARVGITDWIPGIREPRNSKLITPEDLHALPASETTIAEVLKSAGYKTFFAGKWHLGGEGSLPTDHGFEINVGGNHTGSPRGGYYAPYKNPQLKQGPDGEYLPDRLTNDTIAFIEENQQKPFFAYLSFYTVHTPIQAAKRHLLHYQDKVSTLTAREPIRERDGQTTAQQQNPAYASMVQAMDDNVGRLMDTLDRLKIADKTIVIFTSDNGGLSTKKTPGPTSNLPYRAGKGWCYEGGIRVPVIIRVPGVTTPGSKPTAVIHGADFFPTILELTGLPLMPQQHVDGVSLLPTFANKSLNRTAVFWHYPHYHGSTWRPGAAVRAGDWKLIHHYDYDEVELFNLAKDLGEQQNLAKSHPEKTRALLAMLTAWQQSVGAKLPQLRK